MIHNSKVLIIGAKGMLGQALREEFAKGNDVVGWDRDEVNLVEINPSTRSAGLRVASSGVETATSSGQKIRNLGPGLVINAAGFTDVDRCEEEPQEANLVNGYAVGYLAAICKELDIPLVHYSTDYVFDGTKKEGYAEGDQPNPISAYGRSKFLGEQELQRNTEEFYLIRLSRLFGSSSPATSPALRAPSPGLGREGERSKKSFVALMLELAKTKSELEVIDQELSCPTYAPDAAKLTRKIVEDQLPFGIYHGANAGNCTWYGFAREIFKLAGINVKLLPVPASRFPRPAKRPPYSVLLNTKLPPVRPWQEALAEYLNQESRIRK